MPQLQINQGPQDALLYDNTRSYFTNVGYVRTSNFQTEYRHADATTGKATLGGTTTFVIPKSADLLGPVDLLVDLKAPSANGFTGAVAASHRAFTQWVDELGFAVIEKATFTIGSVDIETITGEQMQIKNELMTSDEMRLGYDHVMKTGRRAFEKGASSGANTAIAVDAETPGDNQTALNEKAINKDYTRLISVTQKGNGSGDTAITDVCGARQLIIPLSFFFTKHVSQYFPLAAIAGCNDVRISIKFRAYKELVQTYAVGSSINTVIDAEESTLFGTNGAIESAKLMCHYVHVTGPEAQTLMNKEHVRLLKLWQHQPMTKDVAYSSTSTAVGMDKIEMDLNFLHPVSTLIVTIRREKDMNTELSGVDAAQKGFFFYHGDGTNPNYDRCMAQNLTTPVTGGAGTGTSQHTCKVKSIQLMLNNTERHPGLDKGIDVNYLQHRLLPALHSNSNAYQKQQIGSMARTGLEGTPEYQRYQMQGSKNIFVYPFSLNPEGSNPSGAVNFSKVSHAKLRIHMDTTVASAAAPSSGTVFSPLIDKANGAGPYRVDVYALYYNWLQIKDGRALLSFA